MGDSDPVDVLELMGDEYARTILAETSQQPLSAQKLQEVCDASERTVYRRLEQLESLGLVEEEIEIDPNGHHRTLYQTTVENVLVELEDGDYVVRIRFEEDTADRFARIWRTIRDE